MSSTAPISAFGEIKTHKLMLKEDEMLDIKDKSPELYEVEIAGVPLRLKSSHNHEMVEQLVALVNSKINEALPLTKTGSIQNASILASLHLAEEFLKLKEQYGKDLGQLESKTQKIIAELHKK